MSLMENKQIQALPKVMLVTTSRAEFGLFYWLIKELESSDSVEFQLVVTGNHLVPEQGYTVDEIESEGLPIAEKIDIIIAGSSAAAKAKSSALGMMSFTDVFSRRQPDLVIVMGDRYELLGIVSAAALMSIPVAHFSGGEITAGVVDDIVRHALTKLSYLHFVTHERHRKRVIQLGESPERVFNVGEPGLEHLFKTPLLNREELSKSIGYSLTEKFMLFTFHPVSSDCSLNPAEQLREVLKALTHHDNYQVLMTYPNTDEGSDCLLPLLRDFESKNANRVKLVPSLGFRRYLSALKHCQLVIGNSSSGLVEAPCYGKATVNIGSRQDGRLRGVNVIDCDVYYKEIVDAVAKALTPQHQLIARNGSNPYGDGKTVGKVIEIINKLKFPLPKIKNFYDLEDL